AGIIEVRNAIGGAAEAYAPAVILVEHRIDEFAGPGGVDALPRRALVLGADGAVLADGPTAEVLHRFGPALHAQGCWLPLSTELEAVFGLAEGLAKPQMRHALRSLATPPDLVTAKALTKRVFVTLHAHDLGVAHTGAATVQGELTLSRINFSLRAGETTVILGANGSGKTTLMLTLAGLLPAARGKVTGARPGMIFQNPEHQFVGGSVRAEVAYGLPASAAPRVDALLKEHRLDHLSEAIPHRLSGGEKRRLSIAAMLAHQRATLIADEPFYGLDRKGTIDAIAAFRGAAANGTAVLFSCHDLRTAATLADRAIVVAEGTIIADGPVFDVLRDSDIRRRSGLSLPPLLEVLFDEFDGADGAEQIRQVLDGLNSAVSVVTR
ncbi:MAG TPA: energy-coupling factor ABC transporter ATP-binding protein, partial [Glaciihabitans sp.]|nr:energy-coupling factor ABC transporter ATP-binding protein [Glaciihabitans sp.]